MNWKHRLQAVLAALFGVQSEHNRQIQFRGSPWPYLALGVVFIGILVLALLAVVWLVLGEQSPGP